MQKQRSVYIKLELKTGQYIGVLFLISFGFFLIITSWLYTNDAYRDVLLTFVVVHLVMSKLITIKDIK